MDKIKEFEELLKKHKILYYQGRPEISDVEFDRLEKELRSLDPDNFMLNAVGTSPSSISKVKHSKKMLSLNKTYDLDELKAWIGAGEVVSTKKIDGVSCSLIYKNGKLELAKTRGDGSWGEDITAKVIWMESVPKQLNEKDRNLLEVRGEMFCTEKDFAKLSEEMVSIGMERPTSQRNIVAGLIGRKENIELCRYITFKSFDYLGEEEELSTEMEKFEKLTMLGFDVPEYILHKDNQGLEKVVEDVRIFMEDGHFQIDGIVFSYNDLKLHIELGETAHHPRYKMAFKFRGETKRALLKEIVWSVSRNGVLTPIGNIEPVELSGATISRVTLHNYGMVRQHRLKEGDVIEIIRSGEVIPKFLSVVERSDCEYTVPRRCPECTSLVVEDDIRLRCLGKYCSGRIKESILNFVQKIGIDDLSSKRLEEMIRVKLIKNIPDLYRLTKSDFFKLDKVKNKLANKLYQNIQKSKEVSLTTFLSALGISGGAYNRCEKVVSSGLDNIEKVLNLTPEQLMQIDSFAEKSAEEFYTSLRERHPIVKELLDLGFTFKDEALQATRGGKLGGKKICITGALSEKRSVIESRIRDNGGLVVGSVSKKTDYLLTNESESNSSKFKKAKNLKVAIINELELKNLLE